MLSIWMEDRQQCVQITKLRNATYSKHLCDSATVRAERCPLTCWEVTQTCAQHRHGHGMFLKQKQCWSMAVWTWSCATSHTVWHYVYMYTVSLIVWYMTCHCTKVSRARLHFLFPSVYVVHGGLIWPPFLYIASDSQWNVSYCLF